MQVFSARTRGCCPSPWQAMRNLGVRSRRLSPLLHAQSKHRPTMTDILLVRLALRFHSKPPAARERRESVVDGENGPGGGVRHADCHVERRANKPATGWRKDRESVVRNISGLPHVNGELNRGLSGHLISVYAMGRMLWGERTMRSSRMSSSPLGHGVTREIRASWKGLAKPFPSRTLHRPMHDTNLSTFLWSERSEAGPRNPIEIWSRDTQGSKT